MPMYTLPKLIELTIKQYKGFSVGAVYENKYVKSCREQLLMFMDRSGQMYVRVHEVNAKGQHKKNGPEYSELPFDMWAQSVK